MMKSILKFSQNKVSFFNFFFFSFCNQHSVPVLLTSSVLPRVHTFKPPHFPKSMLQPIHPFSDVHIINVKIPKESCPLFFEFFYHKLIKILF